MRELLIVSIVGVIIAGVAGVFYLVFFRPEPQTILPASQGQGTLPSQCDRDCYAANFTNRDDYITCLQTCLIKNLEIDTPFD